MIAVSIGDSTALIAVTTATMKATLSKQITPFPKPLYHGRGQKARHKESEVREMGKKIEALKDKIDDKLSDAEFAEFSANLSIVISLISLTATVLLILLK